MNLVDSLRLLSLAAIWGASFLFMRIIAPEIGLPYRVFQGVDCGCGFAGDFDTDAHPLGFPGQVQNCTGARGDQLRDPGHFLRPGNTGFAGRLLGDFQCHHAERVGIVGMIL